MRLYRGFVGYVDTPLPYYHLKMLIFPHAH